MARAKKAPKINLDLDGIPIPEGLTKEKVAQQMIAASPLVWIRANNIMLNPMTPFALDEWHLYEVDILNEYPQRQCFLKGAQMGFSTMEVLKSLHGLLHGRYRQGVGYLFPTGDDAGEFTKYRFNPLIEANPAAINRFLSHTDTASIKQIGNAFLYIRGARPSAGKIGGVKDTSTKLKSFSADKIVFDECDEMDPSMIAMARQRFGHSENREEVYLSTPSIPEYGIDLMFAKSDQRVWMIRCQKCNGETCLELEFPNCLRQRPDGSVYRACIKCGEEIYPYHGRWVAQYPDRTKELVGRWISQLVSRFVPLKEIWETYQDPSSHNMTMQEFHNSILGMAYIEAENRLTVNDVLACCSNDAMTIRSDDDTAIGVDVGRELHCVVGKRKTKNQVKVEKVVRLTDFNHLHDLARDFNCRSMVLDKYPETRKVRDFQAAEPYPVWLCGYQDGKKKGDTTWDEKTMEIQGHRTELLDASHRLVAEPGLLELPRKDSEVLLFAQQMTNVAKVIEEDKETRDRNYKYKKVGHGGDHYRHALTYFMLASQRVGVVSDKGAIARFWERHRQRPVWAA